MKSVGILASVVVLAATVASCSSSSSSTANGPCKPSGDGTYVDGLYDTLDKYCMVSVQDGAITTSETPSATPTIVEYELNTPLFSDYALKVRTVWMPPGTQGYNYMANGRCPADGIPVTVVGKLLMEINRSGDTVTKAWADVLMLEMNAVQPWDLESEEPAEPVT